MFAPLMPHAVNEKTPWPLLMEAVSVILSLLRGAEAMAYHSSAITASVSVAVALDVKVSTLKLSEGVPKLSEGEPLLAKTIITSFGLLVVSVTEHEVAALHSFEVAPSTARPAAWTGVVARATPRIVPRRSRKVNRTGFK